MKNLIAGLLSFSSILLTAQGFNTIPVNYNLPNGGKITGGNTLGFNFTGGSATASENTGSQTWSLMDMNGDGKQDLVICAQLQGGNVTSFSPSSNQTWKVHLNNGNSFDSNPINWPLPNGGAINGGITYGFNATSGFALSTHNTGSQSWTLLDMNGDKMPDLVVTAQLQGGNVTSFSPTSNQTWKVYLNTGSAFNTTPINWALPNGGLINGGITFGYNSAGGTALTSHNAGSQTWGLVDMNQDGLPDLVVCAQLQGGNVTSFSPSSNQFWKVYLNQGTSFDTNPTNWNLPNGGLITGGITYGFNSLSGFAISTHNSGSQTWALVNLDNDDKIDLLVTAQLQGGNVTSFSPTSNQYWKLYSNNGSGFNSTPANFNLPNGGKINGGVTFGFNELSDFASSSENSGSQSWGLNDMNADGKLDLVIYAQLQGGLVSSFSPTSNQYWKVFYNNGNGFNSSSINWSLPNGGRINGGNNYGFDGNSGISGPLSNTGSQTWSLADLDGDNLLDLIINAQVQGGNVTSFSPTSNQYWMVYKNNLVNIKENNNSNLQVIVSPNPSTGLFKLNGDKEFSYKVYTSDGKLIKDETKKSFNHNLNLTEQQLGIYFVEIENDSNKSVFKVIIQK